jgi:hypothetical protein
MEALHPVAQVFAIIGITIVASLFVWHLFRYMD